MRSIELPCDTWRAVIANLRAKRLPSMLEHADRLEQQFEQHPPEQATVTLHFTDDMFLRSYNWARWRLGFPLPTDCAQPSKVKRRKGRIVGEDSEASTPSDPMRRKQFRTCVFTNGTCPVPDWPRSAG